MITVTQFNIIQLKAAKNFLAKAPAPAPAPAPAAEAPAGEEAPAEVAAPAPTGPSAEVLSELGTQLKIDEKKVEHLMQALRTVGNRLDRVRMVRVVQSEGAPSDAVKVGEFAYIVDLSSPAPGKSNDRKGDRRDGKRGDGKRGGGGGGGRSERGGGRPERGAAGGRPPAPAGKART